MTTSQRPEKTARGEELLPGLADDLAALGGALGRVSDALAAPHRLTGARWKVLEAASAQPPMTVAQIARRLGQARQGVQRVADLMVADSLAHYVDNPDHARSPMLEVTDVGRAVLRAMGEAARAWQRKLGPRVKPAELESARRTLRELTESLRELDQKR